MDRPPAAAREGGRLVVGGDPQVRGDAAQVAVDDVEAAREARAGLAVTGVVVLQAVAHQRQDDEDDQCGSHGTKFAVHKLPPPVAVLTLYINIPPTMLWPC